MKILDKLPRGKAKRGKKPRRGRTAPTNPKLMSDELRAAEAVKMRIRGMDLDDIRKELGYSSIGNVSRAITRQMENTVQEPCDMYRELESRRLDALLAAIWEKAMNANCRAVDSAVNIIARRCRLWGSDATDDFRVRKMALDWILLMQKTVKEKVMDETIPRERIVDEIVKEMQLHLLAEKAETVTMKGPELPGTADSPPLPVEENPEEKIEE